LIVKPVPRGQEDEREDEPHDEIIRPAGTRVVPKDEALQHLIDAILSSCTRLERNIPSPPSRQHEVDAFTLIHQLKSVEVLESGSQKRLRGYRFRRGLGWQFAGSGRSSCQTRAAGPASTMASLIPNETPIHQDRRMVIVSFYGTGLRWGGRLSSKKDESGRLPPANRACGTQRVLLTACFSTVSDVEYTKKLAW
jgi:hypothetical protein